MLSTILIVSFVACLFSIGAPQIFQGFSMILLTLNQMFPKSETYGFCTNEAVEACWWENPEKLEFCVLAIGALGFWVFFGALLFVHLIYAVAWLLVGDGYFPFLEYQAKRTHE